jgi:hypothetical protein
MNIILKSYPTKILVQGQNTDIFSSIVIISLQV